MDDRQIQLVRMLAEHDQLREEFRHCGPLLLELAAGDDGLVRLLARYVLIDMELVSEVVLAEPDDPAPDKAAPGPNDPGAPPG